MTRNIALSLCYDGHAYHGWQIQKNARSVQETLQDAARAVTKEDVSVIGCGRTDSGVHARRYIASFRTSCAIPADRVPAALNSLLPRDITVIAAQDAAPDFHPIRSCLKKEYTYELYQAPWRDPFRADYALHVPEALDLAAMRRASADFIGTHDFAAMRSTGTEVRSTVRQVYSYDVIEHARGISLVVCANGFLYNMARAMAGTLLAIGRGQLAENSSPAILASRDRARAGATARAQGLYMTNVWYPSLSI